MNNQELTALLDRLHAEPREAEWLEFKANHFEPQVLGEYLSALANSARLPGMPRAYLVFGIADGNHAVVGTNRAMLLSGAYHIRKRKIIKYPHKSMLSNNHD